MDSAVEVQAVDLNDVVEEVDQQESGGLPMSAEVAWHASAQAAVAERTARVEVLEGEIAQLASDMFAGEARFLRLIGEFDELEGWADGRTRSMAHWLNWRLGIAMHAARERVRVAHRLKECPLIAEALAEGRLSYSKVRAITRIVTPQTEEVLVGFALFATASQLERICSTWRGVQRQSAPDAADAQRQRRDMDVRVDEDGDVLLTARLPSDVGAVVLRAFKLAMDILFRSAEADERDQPVGARRVDALAMIAELFLAAGPGAARPQTAASTEGPGGSGWADRADDGSQTDEDAGGTPSDGDADSAQADDEAGGTPTDGAAGGAQADGAANSTPTEGGAAGCGCRGGGAAVTPSDAWQVVVTVDAQVLAAAQDGTAHQRDWSDPVPDAGDEVPRPVTDPVADPPMARTSDGMRLPDALLRRIGCDAMIRAMAVGGDGSPAGIGRRSRVVPGWLRRLLCQRDPGCMFPGCPNDTWTDAHHIWHWIDGGPTDLDNLIRLCRGHHTVVHAQGIGIGQSVTDRTWTFSNPDGTPVPAVVGLPPGRRDRLPVGRGVNRWEGDPARLDLIIDALVQADQADQAGGHGSAGTWLDTPVHVPWLPGVGCEDSGVRPWP
ncbi:hypothetical protein BH23ACT9_BH23ACT9_07570 [soil metagenome]